MKTLWQLLICCLIISTQMVAQKEQSLIPRLSPFQKTEIKIGIVDVTLEYSRPSMRGRKIFGGLETYGEIWRTGANKNTKITFGERVIIGGVTIEAGSYSIFTRPNVTNWDVYIHTELDEFGAPETLDPENVIAQINVPVQGLEKELETLAITFDNLTSNSAIMGIAWEKSYIPVLITIPTAVIIQDELSKNNLGLAGKYESAAYTFFKYEKDNDKAMEAINKCISHMEKEEPLELWLKTGNMSNPNRPRRYLLKAEILASQGKYKEAILAAEPAMEISKMIKSEGYIKRIEEYINEWSNRK